MAVLLAWNLYAFFAPKAPPAVALSYTAFLGQVRADNVASVTLAGQNADGVFKNAIVQPPDVGASAPTAAPTAAQPSAASATPATFTRFTTVMPVTGDVQLLPLLEQHGVSVTVKDTTGGSWFLDLATSLLPVALLVGMLFFMGRQSQRGTQSLFGFGGSKARVYDQEKPGITFADVAGQVEAKAELLEVVDFLKRPQRYRHLGARLPRGVLLIGPPGTGKTLLARAVAGEAGVPFFSISASEFVEMFVGVGASRVRDLFTKAKAAAPAIVFVDEIDAVGRQRGTGMGGGNDEREQTLNQLLVELDGFDDQTSVIVIAATNRPDVLDPALLRPGRFDREVTVGLPDRAGRQAILVIHTRPLRLSPGVDLELLARRTPGFSGADLANLANEAALAAARRGETDEVDVRDFDEAMDKIVLGTRQAGLQDEGERRLVAYHEGGHALVARLTPGADPVSKITIIPHGRALGITEQFSEEDRRNYSRAYLVGRLTILLGGRAAEEVVFSDPTTGAESDLKQATGLARRMVGLWGMSDELGAIWYGVGETHPFLGREMGAPKEYAEATAAELDVAVRKLVERAHQQALEVLQTRRACLDALAAELLLHESLDGSQLDALLAADRACALSRDGQGETAALAAYDERRQ
ncbi:MAG: ATP-dependent zinc metalloprotease FtsH [Chloroflexi bacterium]|nr:ATP-dependent zinc metalloprotease FtsH [Chloroflexota bacterium]MCL5109416.1 ATP-dependent zinc metalloprotease FtsH [Chloroflexota bacterium]